MARTRLRSGRCQAFWSISSSTSSPPWPRMKPATTKAAVRDRTLRRARPATSAPAISRRPKTATGSSRKSTPAAIGGTGETVAGDTGSDTVGYREQRLRRGLARYGSAPDRNPRALGRAERLRRGTSRVLAAKLVAAIDAFLALPAAAAAA